MYVRRAAAVQVVLVGLTRTRRKQQEQMRRYLNAAIREETVKMTDALGDPDRDYSAEESEALATQAERDKQAVEDQRARE